MKSLEVICGWGLTESKVGSDASNLETSTTKVQGGYRLNGDKRWIGMGNRDLLIVWARNTENKKVEGYILDMNTSGITSQPIKHKLALRIVPNCQIHFNNVFIPEENRLPKATDFNKGTNTVLKHSRIFVAWIAVGIALGVYDNVIKYVTERKQFGVPIASFQLQQEKLVRIMASTQAILHLTWRTTKLAEQGKATIGEIAMTKAFVTAQVRDIARLGREMLGGNGIIHD
jgi:acyl-CoA oxidase